MANVGWGDFTADQWAELEPLYGPQPEIGAQVFGQPLDPEPVALLRERANISLSAQLPANQDLTQQDKLSLQFQFAGIDLSRYFIIPYHVSILLREDDEAPGTGLPLTNFIGRGAWLQFFIQGDFDLPIYWATSPMMGGSQKYKYLTDSNDRLQSYDFGFPRNSSANWANRVQASPAGFTINWQIRQTGTNITAWKPVGLRPRFEALCFDRTQLGHSAFYKHFIYQPAQQGRQSIMDAFGDGSSI